LPVTLVGGYYVAFNSATGTAGTLGFTFQVTGF